MIKKKNLRTIILATFIGGWPAFASAQVNIGTYGPPIAAQAVNTGLQNAIGQMNAQRGLVGVQNGAPGNGPAMLTQAQGAQSSSMHKDPAEGQKSPDGKTVHYQVVDPNAGTGTGSDIVGNDELPKRVFSDVP